MGSIAGSVEAQCREKAAAFYCGKGVIDMLEKRELEQLDKGWTIIRIIWGALFGSLAVYLLVCTLIEDRLQSMSPDFPLETMQIVLFGVSILIFFITGTIRKALLNTSVRGSASALFRNPSSQIQNPAVGKYITAIVAATALSESIGIYGVVLFFLSKDSTTLYLFLIMSAISMFYYRPRKEELWEIAAEMQKQSGERKV